MKADQREIKSIPTAGRALSSSAAFLFSSPAGLLLVDLVIAALAYLVAWAIRIHLTVPLTSALLEQERWEVVRHPWIMILICQAFFLYILGMYDDLRVARYREILTHSFTACFLVVMTIISILFLTSSPQEIQRVVGIFPRSVLLLFGGLDFLALVLFRTYVKSRLQSQTTRVLLVGKTRVGVQSIAEEIDRNPWMGLKIVGVAIPEDDPSSPTIAGYPVLGDLETTRDIVDQHNVEQIVFASEDTWKDRILSSLSEVQIEKPLRIAILPSVFEIAIGRLRHLNIHDTPLIEVRRHPNEPLQRIAKRAFDLTVSLSLMILLMPVFLIVAILVKMTSRGPVFYTQHRIGFAGKPFRLFKFRTMIENAESKSGEIYAEKDDPRVTSVGRILRRFRIDELPQLFNVAWGDMSFVGPRPERPRFVETFRTELPGYNERHKVKPGITGLAQVRGYYHTAVENKLKYDLAYIYNYSFSLDLLILLETLKVVLVRRGS